MTTLYITRYRTKNAREALVLIAESVNGATTTKHFLSWDYACIYALSPDPTALRTLAVGERQVIV